MKDVRIGMCQILCVDGDREGNFVRIENAVREATEGGADIVCLPETVILGWVNPDAHERAYPIPGKDTERIGEMARRYRVHICAGLAEKDGERLYDSAVLIDDEGQVILKHRKINTLAGLMEPPYERGSDVGVVETRFGAIGVLICADTFDEGVLERMRALKPAMVLVGYGWAEKEEEWPGHGKKMEDVVSNAAKKIDATVVGTDLVGGITHGPWRGRVYGGQSVVCDREGKVITRCRDRDREVRVLRIS